MIGINLGIFSNPLLAPNKELLLLSFGGGPTAEEEKLKGIIRKGSNPELFFAFNKDGKKFRQYKTKFFEKNPEALTDMNNIISSNPDSWPEVIRNKYGINILMNTSGKTIHY